MYESCVPFSGALYNILILKRAFFTNIQKSYETKNFWDFFIYPHYIITSTLLTKFSIYDRIACWLFQKKKLFPAFSGACTINTFQICKVQIPHIGNNIQLKEQTFVN